MEELRIFYENNYSANLMNLVLVGRHSLDEMQRLVEEHFSKIQNKNLP
jgi:insulysin